MTTPMMKEDVVKKVDQNTGVVGIPKATFDSLMKKVEDQESRIKMLTEIADKSRLGKWDAEHKEALGQIAKISTYEGKIIVAWKSLRDDVYQDTQGRWHELQEVEVIFLDNSVKGLSYMDFARRIAKVDAKVLKRYTTPEGNAMVRCEVMNKQIDIDERFIN